MRSRICACNKKNVKKNHRHKCIRMHTYRIIHQSHFAIAETHAKASRRRDIRRSSEFFNITADLTRDASRDVIATQRASSQSPLQTRLQLSLANKHHRESARGSDFANPGSFPQKKKNETERRHKNVAILTKAATKSSSQNNSKNIGRNPVRTDFLRRGFRFFSPDSSRLCFQTKILTHIHCCINYPRCHCSPPPS